jgi:hypothetical protein
MVGVPITEVANTLVSWLRWMAGSNVGRLDTKTTSLRSVRLKYLGLAILRYIYGSTNLVGCPGCVTFRGWCAIVALPACSGHQGFYVRNEGLSVGCMPDGPAKHSRVLGRYRLETFLRSACLEWLLTVNSCIKVCLDLQADKSPVVVKGPFFPRVVNPRYRIRGTML